MKGLLHRLAARAAGTAVPVRSDVRQPFGGAGLGWSEATDTEADAGRPAPAVAGARHAEAKGAPPGRSVARTKEDAPAPMVDEPAAHVVQAAAVHSFGDAIATPSARHEAAAGTVAAERLPPRLVDGPPVVAAVTNAPAERIEAEPGVQPPMNEPPHPFGQATPGIGSKPMPWRPERTEPTRLMPAAEPSQTPAAGLSAARAPAWAAHPPAQAVKTEEPTEVHVHIGRIDVTAVHEAAPSRRRPAGAPSPMSLDAYLARRSKA
jgi:hypothetical protein